MAKHPLWSDEYWLLLIQLYLRKPVGVKPLYSRGLTDLALELHIPQQFLYGQMFRLRQLDEPRLERLWTHYGKNPRRLRQAVERLRQMKGFGLGDDFYEGVELNESFERDFRPIDQPYPPSADGRSVEWMPLHLILVLDLYFRLTPSTMVAETPEIQELAKLMRMQASDVVEAMEVFQFCDPILRCNEFTIHPLMDACHDIWNRYGNGQPERLAAVAAQMKAYFEP